jgi:hypothetical protein
MADVAALALADSPQAACQLIESPNMLQIFDEQGGAVVIRLASRRAPVMRTKAEGQLLLSATQEGHAKRRTCKHSCDGKGQLQSGPSSGA